MQNRTDRPKPRKRTASHAAPAPAQGAKSDRGARGRGGQEASGSHEAADLGATLPEVNITRRQLIMGTAGLVAAAAVAGGAWALTSSGASKAEAAEGSLTVAQDQVFTTEECEYAEESKGLVTLRSRGSLPFGTILTACSDSVAACLVPTETADPLVQVGLFHLGSGSLTYALKAAAGAADGFQILDARAHGSGLVWLESNLLSGAWRVYSTTLDGAAVGDPVMAEERDGAWALPSLAVSDGFAWWQTSPKDASDKTLASALCRVPFGGTTDAVEVLVEAAGGFAGSVAPAGAGVVTAQRATRSGKTWQLIYVSDETGAVTDSLRLPSTMKPLDASYGPNGFGFTFDSIYQVGDGISNLGTYTPASAVPLTVAEAEEDALGAVRAEAEASAKEGSAAELTDAQRAQALAQAEDAVCEMYSAAEWFRFPRAPVTPPAFCSNWVFVKSTNVVAAVNLDARKYVTIPTESATQGYGEYLATIGPSNRIVTFANVDYTPMDGERIYECTVRVWETF